MVFLLQRSYIGTKTPLQPIFFLLFHLQTKILFGGGEDLAPTPQVPPEASRDPLVHEQKKSKLLFFSGFFLAKGCGFILSLYLSCL